MKGQTGVCCLVVNMTKDICSMEENGNNEKAPRECSLNSVSQFPFEDCLKFSSVRSQVVGLERYYFVFTRKYLTKFGKKYAFHTSVTWKQAQLLCTNGGGQLPSFINAKELSSFISLIKLSKSFPVSGAIYIGLVQRKEVRHRSD